MFDAAFKIQSGLFIHYIKCNLQFNNKCK
jgi:hypothetical protein